MVYVLMLTTLRGVYRRDSRRERRAVSSYSVVVAACEVFVGLWRRLITVFVSSRATPGVH